MVDLSSKAIRRRFTQNLTAGVASQIASVFQQLILIPILLRYWGSELVGVWLILQSASGILRIAVDLGFSNMAASEFGMRRAKGDNDGAVSVFQTIFGFVVVSTLFISLIGIITVWFTPLDRVLGISSGWVEQSQYALSFIILGYFPTVYAALICAAYRGDGKMAKAIWYNWVIVRILDVISVIIAVAYGGDLIRAALASLLTNILLTFIFAVIAHYDLSWMKYGTKYISWELFIRLLSPALAHSAAPVTNMLNISAINIVVSHMLGSSAVTTVTVIRTLGNIALQCYSMLVNASWPEISSLIGAREIPRACRFVERIASMTFWMTIFISLFLFFLAKPILFYWTRGKVEPEYGLLLGQLLAIVVSNFWRVPSVVLLATNRNERLAVVASLAAVVNVAITGCLLPLCGFTGVGIGLLTADILIVLVILPRIVFCLETSLSSYLKASVRFPFIRVSTQS